MLINFIILVVASTNNFSYQPKRSFVCYICLLLLKVLVGVLAVLELSFNFDLEVTTSEEWAFACLTTTLLYSISILFVFQYLMTTVLGGFIFLLQQLRQAIASKSERIRHPKKIIKVKKKVKFGIGDVNSAINSKGTQAPQVSTNKKELLRLKFRRPRINLRLEILRSHQARNQH